MKKPIFSTNGVVKVSAMSQEFIASEEFRGNDNIIFMNGQFIRDFMPGPFSGGGYEITKLTGEQEIVYHDLNRPAIDGFIIDELGDDFDINLFCVKDLILRQLSGEIDILVSGYHNNIFYVRDEENRLRMVKVFLNHDGKYRISSDEIDNQDRLSWRPGDRVFSVKY